MSPTLFSDSLGTAAVLIPEPCRIPGGGAWPCQEFVGVKSEGETYFSFYFTQKESIQGFKVKLERLEDKIFSTAGGVVAVEYFSARLSIGACPIQIIGADVFWKWLPEQVSLF